MSVLIKGMEMPTSCAVCPFENYGDCYGGKVNAIMDIDDYVSAGKRHPRCPLVPVPPHGDLIDRDGAVRDLRMDYAYAAARIIALQPTIIPAEEATQREERQDEASAGPYDILYEEGGVNT